MPRFVGGVFHQSSFIEEDKTIVAADKVEKLEEVVPSRDWTHRGTPRTEDSQEHECLIESDQQNEHHHKFASNDEWSLKVSWRKSPSRACTTILTIEIIIRNIKFVKFEC